MFVVSRGGCGLLGCDAGWAEPRREKKSSKTRRVSVRGGVEAGEESIGKKGKGKEQTKEGVERTYPHKGTVL